MRAVEPAEGLHGLRDQGLHLPRLRHIGFDKDGLTPVAGDKVDGFVSTDTIDIGHGNACTSSSEGDSRRATDARASSRDNRDLSF